MKRRQLGVVFGVSMLVAGGACRSNSAGLPEPVASPTPERPATTPANPDPADPGPLPDAGSSPMLVDAGTSATDAGPLPPASPACQPDQIHCAGHVPQICGANGAWVNGQACAFTCDDDMGCVNRFAAVSAGRGSPTNAEGVAEFARNTSSLFSKRGGLLGGGRGLNVVVIHPVTGDVVDDVRTFDNWDTRLTGSALGAMADYLDALEPGWLVMIASCDDAGLTNVDSCERLTSAPATRLFSALARLGSQQIGAYCFRGAWSLVARTGEGHALAEKLSDGAKVTVEVVLPALR